jgi:ABC-type uncharacterized transport system permease subunit
VVRRPSTRAESARRRRQRALNPLGFVASALAISGTIGLLTADKRSDGLLASISGAASAHRSRWQSSPAAFFYYLATLGRARAAAAVVLSLILTGLALGLVHRIGLFDVGVPHFVSYMSGYVRVPDTWFWKH